MGRGARGFVVFVQTAALGLGLLACSGKSGNADAGSQPDVGGAAGGDAAVEHPLSTGACDLVAQDCPDGTRCDFFCDGQVASIGCRPGTGGAALGQLCSATMPCVKGTGCLATSGSGVMCRQYCNGDADCPAGRCHNVNVAINCGVPDAGTLSLKVCF